MSTKEWRHTNPEKMRKYRRDWYSKNKEHAKSRVSARKDLLREWMRAYKSNLYCTKCGESHPATIHFHHLDPDQKEVSLSQVVDQRGWSIDRIKKEIEKCIVVCANCHAKIHYEEKHGLVV